MKAGSSNWMSHRLPAASSSRRLLVEDLGEGHRHLGPVAVMLIGQRVDDGHGPGHGEFQRAVGLCARAKVTSSAWIGPRLRQQLGDHGGAVGVVAVVAYADPGLLVEVDALDLFQDAVDEMLSGLLAVGDDVDSGRFLIADRQADGVVLGFLELGGVFGGPGRPELFGLGQPCRFWQAAGDGCFQHGGLPVPWSFTSGLLLLSSNVTVGSRARISHHHRAAHRPQESRNIYKGICNDRQ